MVYKNVGIVANDWYVWRLHDTTVEPEQPIDRNVSWYHRIVSGPFNSKAEAHHARQRHADKEMLQVIQASVNDEVTWHQQFVRLLNSQPLAESDTVPVDV